MVGMGKANASALRVHVGRVELVPEPPPARVRFTRFRANLAACRFLLAAVLIAQVADVVTTQIALTRGGFVEENGLLRSVVYGGPVGTLALKLGAVLAVLTWALLRLPTRRTRGAVGLALALSLIGPVANLAALFGR